MNSLGTLSWLFSLMLTITALQCEDDNTEYIRNDVERSSTRKFCELQVVSNGSNEIPNMLSKESRLFNNYLKIAFSNAVGSQINQDGIEVSPSDFSELLNCINGGHGIFSRIDSSIDAKIELARYCFGQPQPWKGIAILETLPEGAERNLYLAQGYVLMASIHGEGKNGGEFPSEVNLINDVTNKMRNDWIVKAESLINDVGVVIRSSKTDDLRLESLLGLYNLIKLRVQYMKVSTNGTGDERIDIDDILESLKGLNKDRLGSSSGFWTASQLQRILLEGNKEAESTKLNDMIRFYETLDQFYLNVIGIGHKEFDLLAIIDDINLVTTRIGYDKMIVTKRGDILIITVNIPETNKAFRQAIDDGDLLKYQKQILNDIKIEKQTWFAFGVIGNNVLSVQVKLPMKRIGQRKSMNFTQNVSTEKATRIVRNILGLSSKISINDTTVQGLPLAAKLTSNGSPIFLGDLSFSISVSTSNNDQGKEFAINPFSAIFKYIENETTSDVNFILKDVVITKASSIDDQNTAVQNGNRETEVKGDPKGDRVRFLIRCIVPHRGEIATK